MFKKMNLSDGTEILVIVPIKTENRLRETCFDPDRYARAGSFLSWQNTYQLFLDELVWKVFRSEVMESLKEWDRTESFDASVTIKCDNPIGWSSTDDINLYGCKAMELFRLRRPDSWGFRIKSDMTSMRAPLTCELTLVYSIRFDRDKNMDVVIVHSIYPGPDIGELEGHVSDREGIVFFDWNHLGE